MVPMPKMLKIYLDFNKDGFLDPNNEQIAYSQNDTLHNLNLKINGAGQAAYDTVLRLRVISDFAGNPLTPCTNPTHGQVEDYGIVLKRNTNPPLADFTTSQDDNCDTSVQFIDQTSNAVDSWFWDFGDGSTDTTANPTHTYSSFGQYTVKLRVGNSYGVDSIVKTQYVKINPSPAPACIVTSTTPGNTTGIYSVQLDTFTHNSGSANTDGGYLDYTCQNFIPLLRDSTYTLTIDLGPTSQNGAAYIDYSGDGTFQTTPEQIMSWNASNGVQTQSFTVPSSAQLEEGLRLRVITEFIFAGSPNSCGTGNNSVRFGQAEDYTVYIQSPPTPPQASFSVDNDTTCTGLVQFTNTTIYHVDSLFWDFGDGTTSTTSNPQHQYATPGTYTVQLVACNNFGCDTSTVQNSVLVSDTLSFKEANCTVSESVSCFGANAGLQRGKTSKSKP